MKFLCAQHRQQMVAAPQQAVQRWQDWMQRGNALIEAGDWQRACPYIGCSFELAEALLQVPGAQAGEVVQPVDRYMIAGHHLAECLGQCGDTEQELHFLLTVHTRLIDWVKQRQPDYTLLKQHLHISMLMLNRYCKRRGGFKGYYDCCVESEWYIKQCLH